MSKSPARDGTVDQARARPERRFVDIDGDRRADAAGVDAAQHEAPLAGLGLLEAEARNLAQIIRECDSMLALKRVAANDRHRLRNVEDLLLALLRGDDDLRNCPDPSRSGPAAAELAAPGPAHSQRLPSSAPRLLPNPKVQFVLFHRA